MCISSVTVCSTAWNYIIVPFNRYNCFVELVDFLFFRNLLYLSKKCLYNQTDWFKMFVACSHWIRGQDPDNHKPSSVYTVVSKLLLPVEPLCTIITSPTPQKRLLLRVEKLCGIAWEVAWSGLQEEGEDDLVEMRYTLLCTNKSIFHSCKGLPGSYSECLIYF